MLTKLKQVLLARFIPHRTAIGLGLLIVTAVAEQLSGSGLCAAAVDLPSICGMADKAVQTIAPWLVIMGVADQKRT